MATMDHASTALPVTVISGYLGAGKTTFINALLQDAQGVKITVLVNDFGTISLDESLIVNRDGDVIALANGCMCCQIGGDLYRTIDRILQRRTLIDHLVIETSGVADPAKIADIARAEPDMRLAHVMTVIDTLNFNALLEDQQLADTLQRQARAADILLLTKGELSSSMEMQRLKSVLAELHPETRICEDAGEARSIILQLDDTTNTSKPNQQGFANRLETHKVPFESWSWSGKEIIPRQGFLKLIEDSRLAIYRCKGIIRFDDGTAATVHKVGEKIDIEMAVSPPEESHVSFIGPSRSFSPEACQKAWDEMISMARATA